MSYLYAICSAPSHESLIVQISKHIEDMPDGRLVSVSHDSLMLGDGSFLWSALMTLEKANETHSTDTETGSDA
jgi:hypothetical protein